MEKKRKKTAKDVAQHTKEVIALPSLHMYTFCGGFVDQAVDKWIVSGGLGVTALPGLGVAALPDLGMTALPGLGVTALPGLRGAC
jgi:hypothetical protein